jgi:hypothetical protein
VKNARPETTRTPPTNLHFTMHGDSARHPAAPKSRAWHSDRSPLHDVRHHARRPKAKACGFVFPRTSVQCSVRQPAPSGGARRDRTDDLLLAKQALSQLSYGPFQRSAVSTSHQKVLGHQNPEGAADQHHASAPLRRHAATEPSSTPFMTDRRWLIFGSWWAWEDLNFRPHAYQARALTN